MLFNKAFFSRYKIVFLVLLLLCAHIFLRFYQFESRNGFGVDQVDNAWAAKNIIVDGKLPLLGMVAKGNSGFYIGPAYYYLISVFYFVTNLDPIASGIFAGVTSIFTFLTVFYISKKLFNIQVALIAVFIHTVSFFIIASDRTQWPVNFIAPISYIIFFSLYNIFFGKKKYLLLLGLALGFSFNIHFTAVFYPIIIILSLPFFPRNKEIIKYSILGFLLFFLFLVPNIISELSTKASSSKNLSTYLNDYYHGLHLRRILQLTYDAFIEFESVLYFKFLRPFSIILFPIFAITFVWRKFTKERMLMIYLMGLWFIVPWVVFAVYRGEISNYYFSLTRPLVVLILAYLSYRLYNFPTYLGKIFIVSFWIYYSYINFQQFLLFDEKNSLDQHKEYVKKNIEIKSKIEFKSGDPTSYLYYIYTRE